MTHPISALRRVIEGTGVDRHVCLGCPLPNVLGDQLADSRVQPYPVTLHALPGHLDRCSPVDDLVQPAGTLTTSPWCCCMTTAPSLSQISLIYVDTRSSMTSSLRLWPRRSNSASSCTASTVGRVSRAYQRTATTRLACFGMECHSCRRRL